VNLNDVNEGIHKYKKRKRIGRGTGSGLGKTSGRGHKGQRSLTPASLKEQSLANYRYDELKVLGDGEITKAMTVSAHKFSKSAKEKIEKAGGKCVVLVRAKPVVKNKMGSKKAAQATGN